MIETVQSHLHIEELRARPDMLEQVALWHQQAWQQQDVSRRREKLLTHLGTESLPTTLLGMQAGEPIGSASLVRYQKLGGYKASVWLANVFVREQHRRRGFGAQLVHGAVNFAVDLGLPELYLYTHDHQRYYAELGWRVVKQHRFADRPITIMRLECGA